jgi:hypothetical protein
MEALPGYMTLRNCMFSKSFPITRHGKVDRTALVARFGAQHA